MPRSLLFKEIEKYLEGIDDVNREVVVGQEFDALPKVSYRLCFVSWCIVMMEVPCSCSLTFIVLFFILHPSLAS
jgi:hypothetical protein